MRLVQLEKARSPMLSTLFPIVTDVRLLHLEKAASSMLVTLLGMVTDVRPLQSEKAPSPMLVTLSGIAVFLHPLIKVFVDISIIELQLSLESYLGLPYSTRIDIKPLQPEKAYCPMLVTLLGMVTDVRPLHLEYLQVIFYQ